jgi:hypothetical protein
VATTGEAAAAQAGGRRPPWSPFRPIPGRRRFLFSEEEKEKGDTKGYMGRGTKVFLVLRDERLGGRGESIQSNTERETSELGAGSRRRREYLAAFPLVSNRECQTRPNNRIGDRTMPIPDSSSEYLLALRVQ